MSRRDHIVRDMILLKIFCLHHYFLIFETTEIWTIMKH